MCVWMRVCRSSEVSSDVCMGEGSQIQGGGLSWVRVGDPGGLSGRVPSERSCDVQLVVCMGECTRILWICCGGH